MASGIFVQILRSLGTILGSLATVTQKLKKSYQNDFQQTDHFNLICILQFLICFGQNRMHYPIQDYIFFKQGISILFNHSNKYLSDSRVCLYAALLLSLWPLMPTMSFFNNWINIVYFLPVGFYLHSIYKKKI